MPNYILPNAIITELGIVNYLHSLYSNRIKRNSFFEQSLNSGNDINNPLTFMFGDNLGTFPNSMGGESTHLLSGVYKSVLDCTEDSLYFGKKKYDRYIYPIKISPHIDDFSGVTTTGSKLNGEYFWKHMSAEALEDAKNGRAIILLDYAQENYIEIPSYERLHVGLRQSGIPPSQVILAFNSFNAKELYETWYPPEQRRLEVINWPFVLTNTSYFYAKTHTAKIMMDEFLQSRNTIRENHFLLKIRRPRYYRQVLLYKLHTDNLLHLGDWSWLSDHTYRDFDIDQMTRQYGFELDKEKIKDLFKQFPHMLKAEQNDTYDTISSWTDSQVESYKNTYFYICTETYTHGEHKSVTEKVCKPMANFLPFVFVSFPGALKLLRELGFKTFSPFIDESYDDEPDEGKRVNMVYKEIQKICSMTKEELHDWYWKMEDIYIHNYKHLMEFYKNDTHVLNLVKYLHERVYA